MPISAPFYVHEEVGPLTDILRGLALSWPSPLLLIIAMTNVLVWAGRCFQLASLPFPGLYLRMILDPPRYCPPWPSRSLLPAKGLLIRPDGGAKGKTRAETEGREDGEEEEGEGKVEEEKREKKKEENNVRKTEREGRRRRLDKVSSFCRKQIYRLHPE